MRVVVAVVSVVTMVFVRVRMMVVMTGGISGVGGGCYSDDGNGDGCDGIFLQVEVL